MWWTYALLSAVFAALTAILAKVGVKGVDSNVATAVRTVVVLVLAWGLIALQGKLSAVATISRTSLVFLILSGCATGASWLFYFRALQMGPASLVSAVDKFSLPLVAVLALVFLNEAPTARQWIGIALVTAGILLMIRPS